MDKIALIRAEIERLKHYAKESKMEWVNEGYNQNAFAEDCRISSFDKLLTFIDTLEEPASEDLEEAAERYAAPFNDTTYGVEYSFKGFKAGAEWGEKNAYKAIMKKADEVRDKRFNTDYEVKIEPAAGFDLGCINVYREGKLVGQYVEPKEEKKLPEDLEEAAKKYDEAESWRWEALKYPRREAFEAGAKWQSKRDQDTIETAEDHAFLAGSNWQKEQMMKDAIDIKVIESYNPACELNERLHGISFIYDCKNDNQYLVAGDRAKIIIVKEEEE